MAEVRHRREQAIDQAHREVEQAGGIARLSAVEWCSRFEAAFDRALLERRIGRPVVDEPEI